MQEGKIIKFYREKRKLTQEKLGAGICSPTHISKIERGLTDYSPEITDLLAKRLEIDLETKIKSMAHMKEKLDEWLEMIIAQNTNAAIKTQKELADNELIMASEYRIRYLLLLLLHQFKLGQFPDDTPKQLKALQKLRSEFTEMEKNLYKHVIGIYHMMVENHQNSIKHSIDILKSIDFEVYENALVYFDLASAYHHTNSPVLAYFYAEKALNLYKQKHNFLGIIDAENLMIIQTELDQHRDFQKTTKEYHNLIDICNQYQAPDKKAKLLHNFAYENLRRGHYLEAAKLYKASMDLKDSMSGIYLLSLEGYIRASFEGGSLSTEELLKEIQDGLEISEKIKDTLYKTVLTLHKYNILKNNKQYYRYLTNKALPYFKAHGYKFMVRRYEKELFTYHKKLGKNEEAVEIANQIIDQIE